MPPNGDKHSEACRQLGTYVEQLGTYDKQLGTWKIPSAELFLRSGEQSSAMRAHKYRTPSVYRKFKGGHNKMFNKRKQRSVQGRAGSHALPVRELQVRTLSNLLPSQFEAKVHWEGVASSPPLSSQFEAKVHWEGVAKARRCQACCSTSGHNEAFKGGHNEAFNERAESPTST